MELMFEYFIFIKYASLAFFGFAFYKTLMSWGSQGISSDDKFAVKFKPKLNAWGVTTLLLMLFLLISPVK